MEGAARHAFHLRWPEKANYGQSSIVIVVSFGRASYLPHEQYNQRPGQQAGEDEGGEQVGFEEAEDGFETDHLEVLHCAA